MIIIKSLYKTDIHEFVLKANHANYYLKIQIKKDDLLLGRFKPKLCKLIYDRLLYIFNDDQYKSKWFMTIKSRLEECKMSEVWENQICWSDNVLKYTIANIL